MNQTPNPTRTQLLILLMLTLSVLLVNQVSGETRIKDITSVHGMTGENLIGYGLVVGLSGTGDGRRATFTTQSLVSMLDRLGVTVDPRDLRVENVAAVVVTAEMDAFVNAGNKIDVTVSSLGDATSLDGGTLLLTPLRASDGGVYAVAQGPVSTGGFSIDAGAGTSVRKNQSTVGAVVAGGVVHKPLQRSYVQDGTIQLALREPDFQTMNSVVDAINAAFGEDIASGIDARNALVNLPQGSLDDPVSFMADIGRLTVTVDVAARVVINEKTGTVVVGSGVEVGEAAIAHGNLQVEINTDFEVSQSESFALGSTVVVPKVSAWVEDKEARIFALKESSTVGAIAQALNEIGVTPRDIVGIFQALKRAGALRAELVIM